VGSSQQRYEIRPLGPWTGPVTVDRAASGRFRADWSDTLDLLSRETESLGARLVVLQVDVEDGEIRRDGMLRAGARVGFPGVRISFDSEHGPLTYATDAYEPRYYGDPPGWKANVRAIALALQALRAVDRYGVTRTGEQYRGWRAIESGAAPQMSVDEAARVLAEHGGGTAAGILADPDVRASAYKRAAKRWHPDVAGGDRGVFERLTAARDLLDAAGDLVGGRR
jgi:hypothetical protein